MDLDQGNKNRVFFFNPDPAPTKIHGSEAQLCIKEYISGQYWMLDPDMIFING